MIAIVVVVAAELGCEGRRGCAGKGMIRLLSELVQTH